MEQSLPNYFEQCNTPAGKKPGRPHVLRKCQGANPWDALRSLFGYLDCWAETQHLVIADAYTSNGRKARCLVHKKEVSR